MMLSFLHVLIFPQHLQFLQVAGSGPFGGGGLDRPEKLNLPVVTFVGMRADRIYVLIFFGMTHWLTNQNKNKKVKPADVRNLPQGPLGAEWW